MTDDVFTLDDLVEQYEPPEQTVPICIKGSVVGEIQHLQYEYVQARMRDQARAAGGTIADAPEAPAIAERIAELQDQAASHTRKFKVRSIGEKAWADLGAQHPPSDKQKADGFTWDPAGFMPVAIAACSVVPKLTVDGANKLLATLSSGQTKRLWGAILECNGGGGVVPKSVAPSVPTRGSPPS